ncbi:2015_t:CDS:1, partial [Funneliformis geosporum]
KRRDERLKELEKNEKLFSKTLDEVKNFLNGLEKDQKFMLEFTEDLKE